MSDPRNREIGFVASSFLFCACSACGRGEAAWAHVDRYPYRWASRVLGSTCCAPLGDQLLCAGVWVLSAFARKSVLRCPAFVRRHVGFKRFVHVAMLFLCTGAWVLRDLCRFRCYICAQARGFCEIFVCCDANFVHRRLGFKRFVCVAMLLLCTCAWVLRDSMPLLCTGAWVLRGFCVLRCYFCAQALGF